MLVYQRVNGVFVAGVIPPSPEIRAFHHDLRSHHVQRRGHRVAPQRRQSAGRAGGEGSWWPGSLPNMQDGAQFVS